MFTILAGAAVKSAMVFALAWLIAKLMRRASAASRHMVWTASAAAVIVLPVFSAWMPAWRVNAPAAWRETAAMFQVSSAATPEAHDAAGAPRATRSSPVASRRIALPDGRTIIAGVWAFGSALAVLHMLAGYAAIARLRRKLARRGKVEGVELLESRAGSMPMAAGIWRPAVFVPADAAEWPEDRKKAVLLHELAHVRRGDAATQLLARIALALYWWNPLAWTAWRESLKERERAADDAVLASGLGAADYAAHLLEIARRMSAPAFAAGVAMARSSQLEGRVLAILDSNASRGSASRWSAAMAAMCAVAVMVPLASLRAQDNARTPEDLGVLFRTAVAQSDSAALDRVAKTAESQRNFDLASKALDAEAEVVARAAGPASAEYGKVILKKAGLEKRAKGLASSETLYSQAVDLLAGKPEQASALINLGEIAMHNKNLETAAAYFSRAQLSEPETSAVATMWLADVRSKQGNNDEAEALYNSAIALADPASQNEGVAMTMYAGFLKKQGRTEEAQDYFARASQVFKQNATHPPASQSEHAFKIGAEVSAPKVISKVEPEYSEEARLAGLQGTVVLSVTIGEDGTPHNITVTRSLGMELDDKAIAAVSQWKFSPGMRGGEPVPVKATIEVNFHLL